MLVNDDLLPKQNRPIFIILAKDEPQMEWKLKLFALKLIHRLMEETSATVLLAGDGNVSKQFARANKHNAIASIVIGSKEIQQNIVNVKQMDTSQEISVSLSDLTQVLEKEFLDK